MDASNSPRIFHVLKQRVDEYFRDTNKSRFADATFWIKAALFLMVMAGGYALILTAGRDSVALLYPGFLAFLLGAMFFVVNVGHDASHRAVHRNKAVNQALSNVWNVVGISRVLWEIKHHQSHHAHTNVPHKDFDIGQSQLVRLSPRYAYRSWFRYQHLYISFLYFLFGIFIVYGRDFMMLYSPQVDDASRAKLPRFFLARLFGIKLFFLAYSFLVPMLVLPHAWWQVLLPYLLALAICGAIMLLILIVPHINNDAACIEESYAYPSPSAWALHQIYATVDSSPGNPLLGWMTGGLNTHLVHHLFPSICHTHYRALTRVIRRELAAQGIPYKHKSFVGAIVDHFRFLKVIGRQAEMPEELLRLHRPQSAGA